MLISRLIVIALLLVSAAGYSRNNTTLADVLDDTSLISHEGRDLPLIEFKNLDGSNNPAKHKIYFQAGLHGDELLAIEFAYWLAQRLESKRSILTALQSYSVGIDIMPVANPDGMYRVDRLNFRDVNLNRNFSVLWGKSKEEPGKKPFSEKETEAVRRLFIKNKYFAAIDIHGYVNWLVAPTKPNDFQTATRDQYLKYSKLISTLDKTRAALPGKYLMKTAGDLGDGGAFEDWAFWSAGSYSFCLELTSRGRYDFVKENQGLKRVDFFLMYERFIFNTLVQLLSN